MEPKPDRASFIPNSDTAFFTITTFGLYSPKPTMGRKSTDSAAQIKSKTKASSSNSAGVPKPAKTLASTSGGTPKPSTGSKKSRAVESDEVEVDELLDECKRKKAPVALTTTKKSVNDKPKPSTSKKDVRSPRSKPAKSPLTAAGTGGNSNPKSAGKKQKAIPEPVEADSEESEQEWVGFGNAGEESEEEGGDDGVSSEEELLHGLSSDDDQDSSDEEVELPGIDVSKLPTIAKDDKVVKQKLEKAKRQPVRIPFTATLFSFVV